jgi:hypothetical protein
MAYNWTTKNQKEDAAKDRKEDATSILKTGLEANPSR